MSRWYVWLVVWCVTAPFCFGQNFSCTQSGRTVKWRIDRPNVKSARTDYENVVFHAGDSVSFSAGGCVQTRQSGGTWKTYKGAVRDGDNQFYGTVEIPKVLPLQPLRDVTSSVTIPANVSETHLVLGYVDDDYSHNGYWGPDQGRPPQCAIHNDAFVEIGIQQGTLWDACPKRLPKPFDVEIAGDGLDTNGFPINPFWGAQLASTVNQPPDADACHYSGASLNLFDPKCTDVVTTINAPTGLHKAVCGLSSSPAHGKPRAHFNWTPVTYVAPVYWGSHQDSNLEDDDIDLWITPPRSAGIAAGNKTQINGNIAIEVEFRMRETLRRFIRGAVPGWDEIVDAIDQEDNTQGGDPNGPSAKFNNRCAVVVGVLGLDCDHGCKSELHPALVLALHTKDDPADDTWLIFARNIGNEGFCSSKFEHLRLTENRLGVAIPRPGAQLLRVLDSSKFFSALNNSTLQVEMSPINTNSPATVSFQFPDDVATTPEQAELIFGELHLQWSNTGTIRAGDHACGASLSGLTLIRGAEEEETDGLRKAGLLNETRRPRGLRLQLENNGNVKGREAPPPARTAVSLKITVAGTSAATRPPSRLEAVQDPNQDAKEREERQNLCGGFTKRSTPSICRAADQGSQAGRKKGQAR